MKTRFLCIIVASLFAQCISAQEQYIQVKTIMNDRKTIDITLTNTSDKKMQIWCYMRNSNANSRFCISFLDNNGKTIVYRDDVEILKKEFGKPPEMIVIEPHSFETIQYPVSSLMLGMKEGGIRYHSIKTFQIIYDITYLFPGEKRSSPLAGVFRYTLTTDPIAF